MRGGGTECESRHASSSAPWEYDAPRYHDFEQASPSHGECSVDEWFDTSATKGLRSPVSGASPDSEEGVQGDVTSTVVGSVKKNAVKERKVLGNVTNTIMVADPVVAPAPQKQHSTNTAFDRNKAQEIDTLKTVKLSSKATPKGDSKTSAAVQIGAENINCSKKKQERSAAVRKEDDASKKQDAAMHRPVTRLWTGKLTVPKSPMLLSRMRGTVNKKVIKSSEEIEMEEIEKKKREVASLRKKSQHHRDKGAVEQPRQPQKRKQVTVPKAPNLRTSKRMRTATSTVSKVAEPSGFTVGKTTGTSRQKRHINARAGPSVTSRPVTRSQNHKLTRPKTPNFATKSRVRGARFKTTEELELEEIAKNQFKAKPLNRKILERKQSSNPAVKSKKPVTVPQPFSFATEKRAASGHSRPVDVPYPKPFIFGEGPVTRSMAKVATVMKSQKVSLPEKPDATRCKNSSSMDALAQPKIRPVTRGSLLLGGAMRIIKNRNEEEAQEEDAPPQCAVADGVHDFIKNRGNDEKSTLHNPLFRL